MRSMLGKVLGASADAVFPRRCLACGCFLSADGRPEPDPDPGGGFYRRFGAFLCPDCLADFTPLETPLCTCCGAMFEGRAGDDHLCGRCLEKPPAFSRARAAGIYSGTLLCLVHDFKYRTRTELARPLSGLMLDAFHRFWETDEIDGVVAVPLHPRRLRSRGFNQAELLIRHWGREGDARCAPGPLLSGALVRQRVTAAQAGLGRRQRAANIRGAFAFSQGAKGRVAGMQLLLVDDVMTTGATANECSRVLTAAGAKRVCVLTLARSLAPETVGPGTGPDPGCPGTGT
jgi:ComF family protein